MTAEDGQPVAVQVTKDWKSRLADMACNQGPAFVVMAIVMYWGANQIPVHLAAIQGGYKEIVTDARAERAEILRQHAETVKNLQATFKAENEWLRQWTLNRNQGALRPAPTANP